MGKVQRAKESRASDLISVFGNELGKEDAWEKRGQPMNTRS